MSRLWGVGDEGQVVLDRTPFYAESGGQVGDTGVLVNGSAEFQVVDTQKLRQRLCAHRANRRAVS